MNPLNNLILFLCMASFMSAQQRSDFGQLSPLEKNFLAYEKDSAAPAVFLYEKGNNFFELRNNRIYLITQYHAKIKVLKKEGLEKGTIEIPYYHNDQFSEKVFKVKALTHNGNKKTYLKQEDIHTVDNDGNWSQKTFALPDVQTGSVLEYSYEIQSPFFL